MKIVRKKLYAVVVIMNIGLNIKKKKKRVKICEKSNTRQALIGHVPSYSNMKFEATQ